METRPRNDLYDSRSSDTCVKGKDSSRKIARSDHSASWKNGGLLFKNNWLSVYLSETEWQGVS
jgi:hypothetical protein